LQVRLQRVSNLLGIDLPVVHVECKGFQYFSFFAGFSIVAFVHW
jgi:hypothetical protein